MAEVRLQNVNKIYQGKAPAEKAWWEFWRASSTPTEVHVVKDANLDIKDGEFMVLVGPSGCGKSTTLRMIAGLEEITSGDLFIGDRKVNEVSPKDRDIAMVFQNYALYPHMSVYDNMAFGLKLRKFDPGDIEQRVQDAAKKLGIEALLKRKPKELSGGQRQRVAMGRAIVRKPKVFLMDEPLSNLDAKLRVQMRGELQKLHRELGVTTVYVTHDQTEAMTLGDRIVIMKDGYVQQIDTPLNLYERPSNLFVAGFIGSPGMNFMPVKVASRGDGFEVTADGFSFQVKANHGGWQWKEGEATLGIRPQDISEASEASSEWAELEAEVEVIEPLGSENFLYCRVGENPVAARVAPTCPAKVGEKVKLAFALERFHLFDGEGQALVHPAPKEKG